MFTTSRRFSIKYKIAVGYILILCCLGAAIIMVSERISVLQNEIETMTARDMEINNLITSIRYSVVNMETSQRGYLLTGNESYLTPYMQSKAGWIEDYELLYEHFSSNPERSKDLESIKATIEHWIETAAEPTIELKRENQTQAIIDFFADDAGKQDVEQLREQLETLRLNHLESNKAYIADLDKRNSWLLMTLIGMLVAVAIISFFIVSYVSGAIVKTITQVSSTIKEIADSKGDLTKRIKVGTRDEVRDLAEATNVLLGSLEAQSWVQRNVAEVATMNQGLSNLTELASSFLSKVAPIIGASYGVLYYRRGSGDKLRLEKLSAYAAYGDDTSKESFRLGEGLVGQCAQDNRPFLLNQPENYSGSIASGTMKMRPRSVLIVPVEFERKVIAVMEFASIEPFKAEHLKLLEAIEEHFGVTIDNTAGRMEVERLLAESQAMTEELQAQTEELQAQSEELQMQQEEMRMTTEHLEEQNLYAEQKTKELEQAKAELEDYAEKLKQSAQYKTNFLANMSHELRTPLNSILILSQMLSENDSKSLSQEEVGYAKVIHSSGNDLLALIDDILDLSKIEAGKISLVMDEVSVAEIPELLKLVFDPVAEKKGLDFRIELQKDLPPIMQTDGQRLQQILKNLLSNAFKFTETGSVTLKLHRADPAAVSARMPDACAENMLAFSVIDTGIGIPKDKQGLIFEAFQQVDGNTNRIYGGTGLGLSICSEFAQLLGGYIALDSELHKGSTFTLYAPICLPDAQHALRQASMEAAAAASAEIAAGMALPQPSESPAPAADRGSAEEAGKEQPQAKPERPEEVSLLHGKKVLLVEDDARNVFAVVKALEAKGLHVTVAGNGQECMDIVASESDFDLVLMDIMMPVMDGFETTRALRQHPIMKDTPIIALTAKAMKSDQESCLAAGASDYISKPIQMEQLFSLMRVWLTKQVGQE
ncbi:response regulator [Paenibacillus soyae]|uniref:Circadian input-output histidine kinase CikA n=1 Tax=Paenibacillus soyae TaxID=2969249 RepID=A0A9X2MZU0_9BACL|nr:response regulator [Paenibacillus soyae]MCR2806547.1 ATP-binding protein [Paenibacillus soyae]